MSKKAMVVITCISVFVAVGLTLVLIIGNRTDGTANKISTVTPVEKPEDVIRWNVPRLAHADDMAIDNVMRTACDFLRAAGRDEFIQDSGTQGLSYSESSTIADEATATYCPDQAQ